MASIEPGQRFKLYNGSGTWGHSDGVVVEIRDDGNIVCDFVERHSGDTYQLTFGAEQWALLVMDGYLEVKDGASRVRRGDGQPHENGGG